MAPKKITIADVSGEVREHVGNQAEFNALVQRHQVKFLLDHEGVRVPSFESLEDGGGYTLGQPLQQQQQQQQQQQDIGDLAELVDFVRSMKMENQTLVFSTVQSESYRKVIARMGVKLKGAKWKLKPHLTDEQHMPHFTWRKGIREDNTQNRIAYMKHLRTYLTWPQGHDIVDCNEKGLEYGDLLSVPSLWDDAFKTSGNIDVVLAAKEDVDAGTIRNNIRAGIELKSLDNPGDHEQQVILQHLTASMLNPDQSVITLMTDLNTRWHFYWFASKGKVLYKIKARESIFFLSACLRPLIPARQFIFRMTFSIAALGLHLWALSCTRYQ